MKKGLFSHREQLRATVEFSEKLGGIILALCKSCMKQLSLIKEKKYAARKCARSISLRGTNHIVLKSKRPTLRRNRPEIRRLLRETQDRFGVKLRAVAIMDDHVHFVLKVSSRRQFADALRFLAGGIARKISAIEVWAKRAWSRPIKVARDLRTVEIYVARNSIKAEIFTDGDAYFILDGVLQL